MKKFLTSALASLVAISATTANAGGPVVVAEEPVPMVEDQATSGAVLPLLLVGIALCVALCGGSDDDRARS